MNTQNIYKIINDLRFLKNVITRNIHTQIKITDTIINDTKDIIMKLLDDDKKDEFMKIYYLCLCCAAHNDKNRDLYFTVICNLYFKNYLKEEEHINFYRVMTEIDFMKDVDIKDPTQKANLSDKIKDLEDIIKDN